MRIISAKFDKNPGSCFRQDFFSYFPYISLCKICDLGAVPVLTPGALFEQTW